MPSKYIPGAPNPYFATHKYHDVPVYRNVTPVKQCSVHHYVGPAATVEKGIAVDLLTPEHLWATFQKEAEDVLKVDGKWIQDDKERNKRINAAYARLWLADNRFQWAGLAAFASKQVGCGLLHAGDIVSKTRREREVVERSMRHGSVPGARYGATIKHLATEMGGSEMMSRLGFGNKHLFLDIYPLHRFYMERGWKEFNDYLPKRQNKRYAVHWEIDHETLAFGKPFAEIRKGFEHIESGNLKESVRQIARHEQVNILQAIIYDDFVMQVLLAANQFAWVTGLPTGVYQEVQLTLSDQCKAKDGFTSYFPFKKNAKLWLVDERMEFVYRAAAQFHELLNGPFHKQVEESISLIHAGGGIR